MLIDLVALDRHAANDVAASSLDDARQLFEGLTRVDSVRAVDGSLFVIDHRQVDQTTDTSWLLPEEEQPVDPRTDDDEVGFAQMLEIDGLDRTRDRFDALAVELVGDLLARLPCVSGERFVNDSGLHGVRS